MSDLKVNLEDLEVKIEQYPLAQSKHLIEQFLILGYENSIKQEKIINIVKSNIISRNNFNEINSLKEVSLRFLKELFIYWWTYVLWTIFFPFIIFLNEHIILFNFNLIFNFFIKIYIFNIIKFNNNIIIIIKNN